MKQNMERTLLDHARRDIETIRYMIISAFIRCYSLRLVSGTDSLGGHGQLGQLSHWSSHGVTILDCVAHVNELEILL